MANRSGARIIRLIGHNVPIWLVSISIIFLINRYLIRPSGFPFFDYWLNDILCFPILLESTQISMRLILKQKDLRLTIWQVFFACIYGSVLFEWILPRLNGEFVSDLIDVFCYISGATIWYFSKISFR